jgi:Ca-activated chloride channel family protein
MAGELTLIATPHRQAYPARQTPQQAYVLLEIRPAGGLPSPGLTPAASAPAVAAPAVAAPVNLCLALDRSGSMAGEKLRAMKDAAIGLLDRLGPRDSLAVVIFDDEDPAELVTPAAIVSDRDALRRKIERIEERGGTHLSTGLRLGLQELRRVQTPDRVSSLVLLTDGQTWEDQQTCKELADECREAGIPLQVLGFGVGVENNWDPQLLEDLARRSGGEWRVVESPKDAAAVFDGLLREAQGTAASNAHLTMRMMTGVSPRAVWRVAPMISRLDHHEIGANDVQIFLGEVHYGAGQAILADLVLPARSAGIYRLIQADVTYDVPGLGLTDQRMAVDVVLNFVEDPQQASDVDQRLMNLIERVTAHRLQTQALDEAAAGNTAKATQRLRAAATRLLELGEMEMAQQADRQARQLEQEGQIDLAAAQKMRYATKRLTDVNR